MRKDLNHKKGDTVTIKNKTWYRKHKDSTGMVDFSETRAFVQDMSKYCGQRAVIMQVFSDSYRIDIDNQFWIWYDECFV